MKKFLIAIAALSMLSLGCATHEETGALVGAGTGAAVGHTLTRGSAVGTLLGAFIGAAVGAEVGRHMDEEDRRRAAYALEYNRTGERYEWVNPDSGGQYSMTPTRTFEGSQGPCRDFVMLTYIDGQPEEVEGTACRQADGTWRMTE